MAHVDDDIQAFAKEISVTAMVFLGLHENIPEKRGYKIAYWHFPIFDSSRETLIVNML